MSSDEEFESGDRIVETSSRSVVDNDHFPNAVDFDKPPKYFTNRRGFVKDGYDDRNEGFARHHRSIGCQAEGALLDFG